MAAVDNILIRHIPDCAASLPQSNSARPTCPPRRCESVFPGVCLHNATCSATDLDCLCGIAWNSPILNGCSATSCDIADGLATINGTATACGIQPSPQTPALLASTIVLGAVAILCIGVRLLGRPKARSQWLQKADDWMMACNVVFVAGMIACTSLAHGYGYGKDTWTLATRDIRAVNILIYNLELLYTFILHLTKLSILYFYLQFFPCTVFPRVRTAIYVTIGLVVASGISFTMAVVFQCTPAYALWDIFNDDIPMSDRRSWRCINYNVYGYTGATINLLFDFWLMALPMPELIKLTLPMRKKIAVCFMFTVGGFVTFITIPRIFYMNHFDQTQNAMHDLLWVSFWGHVECLSSVILACIPSICIVLVRIYRRRGSSAELPGHHSPECHSPRSRAHGPRHMMESGASNESEAATGSEMTTIESRSWVDHRDGSTVSLKLPIVMTSI
ncbi:uncharacterized protein DNG_09968 [Cephalotrichum gorgonifer]|uniref:Rhodopsin domain-containing protein n=1 Tax=Cephalotrichum gorgonifer TaxID=2041049 RepID=A0AAE8SZS9_9PEZI|nr:uncharacterized protein DNG_09968 [Cephalotrichum gorgonifer]